MLLRKLEEFLILPENTRTYSDARALTEARHGILGRKAFLRRIYQVWYRMLLDAAAPAPEGPAIELGAGSGFFHEYAPHVITSDILPVSTVQLVCSSHDLPFAAATVSSLFMADVLHHTPEPARFFRESQRVLKPGGRIAMLEPWNTLWGRFFWDRLHFEPFETGGGWQLDGGRPLHDANGALPWILFVRDREQFERAFPELRIRSIRPVMPFLFIVSGGLTYRSLMPGCSFPLCRAVEWALSPLNRYLAMFALIVLERR
jgi:SAM-dependent methyltransferase